jgi:2-hydroxychromene-2-carboxylate isomerase
VDAETHAARQYAHRVFDSLWQNGIVGRSRAYALLAEELGLTPDQCHMKLIDKETAQRVPAAAHEIGKRLKGITS